MKFKPTVIFAACLAAGAVTTALAAPPHQHGVAALDVAVEPGRVTLVLQSPLDNLLGFERAPRTDAEHQQAKALLAKLNAAEALFHIDSAAGCKLAKVMLTAPALGQGAASPAGGDSHADLEGSFEFTCRAGQRAGFVEVELFDAFPALKRMALQVSTARGQLRANLVRPASRVNLPR